ncbi:hypothetical protein QFW80_00030 [Luteimonas sp. M1R5S18]|uniref:Uncharacterized protein n=1 Tax=Luteimonas rhizosphaericola TaxID=3042024 RepID=A0ABT6JE07_9GAMM|nr:hypothetical protein [Luteimonas rhizosphaericola]MDH5828911.1 hypothetical protein [Luteimonas rhizosphaericola]
MDISEAAKELFVEFPEWTEFVSWEAADDGTRYLVIQVPAPPMADVEHGLHIDTSNNEVTVGFDFYHSHFDDFIGDGEHFGTKAALEFIRQIVSERVAIVSWWSGETWKGSTQVEAGAAASIPSWSAASDIDRVRVRSWQGALNYDGGA